LIPKKNITLVCVENRNYELAQEAIQQCLNHMEFADVLVFSDRDDLVPGARHEKIDKEFKMPDYNNIVAKTLAPHINTDHVLIMQWDSMIYNPKRWTDAFLFYDYIGAFWPWHPQGYQVGNGGFSLRSRRLLDALHSEDLIDPKAAYYDNTPDGTQEDNLMCIRYKDLLASKYKCRWPDPSLAKEFSYELGQWDPDAWGFHGPWNVIRLAPKSTVEKFIEYMPWASLNKDKAHHVIFEASHRMQNLDWTERCCQGIRANKDTEFCTGLVEWFRNENNPFLSTIETVLLRS
jgi:hypothetical protein